MEGAVANLDAPKVHPGKTSKEVLVAPSGIPASPLVTAPKKKKKS